MDPQESDVDSYIQFAAAKGMKITHVIDTHIHADHVSSGRSLAAKTGAFYCLHSSADAAFDFTPLADGEEMILGNVIVKVLHTPGHTRESICLLVTDKTRGPVPWFLLTGDTLFVGAVGRPDLPGQTETGARELFQSLQRKILPLPGAVEIWPGHFSGSICGSGMSGKPVSTLEFERRCNPLLAVSSEGEFVAALTQEVPPKPERMMKIIRRNQGRG